MKSAARLYAVQALFQMEASGQSLDSVADEFETHRFGAVYEDDEMAEGDIKLFRLILEDAVTWQARIDQMTDRALVAKWPIARIDPMLRALFRAAGAETAVGRDAAQGGHHRIRRRGPRLLPGRQGAQFRERRAGPHGARGAPRSVLNGSAAHPRRDQLPSGKAAP